LVADELREQGIVREEKRVARLCSQQRIWSAIAKKSGLDRQAGAPGSRRGQHRHESFLALLQKNVLDRQHWTTREQQLRLAIIFWMERTYHRRRRQRRLGRLT
jgi:putative transposase